MAVTILSGNAAYPPNAKRMTHARPTVPSISLDEHGRLYVGDVVHLLRISSSTLYPGIKNGRYPKPDGRVGRRPYWFTETIRPLVVGES